MSANSTVLLALLIAAVAFDLRERRIPNLLVALGLCLGLALGFVEGGAGGFGESALGAGAGLLVLLPFHAMRMVGAGDAKLMAAVGSLTGAPALLPIALYTFIAGGLLGLVALVSGRSTSTALANLRLLLFAAALRGQGAPVGPADLELKTTARIPYAVAIAAGVILWALTRG